MESDNNRKERERESESQKRRKLISFCSVLLFFWVLFCSKSLGASIFSFVVVALLLFWWFTNFDFFYKEFREQEVLFDGEVWVTSVWHRPCKSIFFVGWKMNGWENRNSKPPKKCVITQGEHIALSRYYQKAINLRIYQNVTTLKLKQIAEH